MDGKEKKLNINTIYRKSAYKISLLKSTEKQKVWHKKSSFLKDLRLGSGMVEKLEKIKNEISHTAQKNTRKINECDSLDLIN